MKDLMTLGMPVYNAEKYIERSLLSALNQTYENIEFILIDDRGNDNSIDVIKNIISNHPRGNAVKIITHPENLGVGEGRNSIIKYATGKYLFFMDNDDEVTVDCIQKLYDEMTRVDVDIVCGSYKENNKMVLHSASNCFVEKDKTKIFLSYFNNRFHISTWNKLYKLSFLRENQILCRQRIIDDHYFTFQALLYADSYSVIPDITYLHYTISTSASQGGEWKENIYAEWIKVFEDEMKLFESKSFSTAFRKKIKKKFFVQRLIIADAALKSPYDVKHYIDDYLNSNFMNGKDKFSDIILFIFYLLSKMPLSVKKIYIPILMRVKKLQKKNNHV